MFSSCQCICCTYYFRPICMVGEWGLIMYVTDEKLCVTQSVYNLQRFECVYRCVREKRSLLQIITTELILCVLFQPSHVTSGVWES